MCLPLWFSNWLSLGARQGQGPRHERMDCMVLCRTFHTGPKQGQGLTPIVPHYSGSGPSPCPSTGHSQCDYTINVKRYGRTDERVSKCIFHLFLSFFLICLPTFYVTFSVSEKMAKGLLRFINLRHWQ